jgi:hypothetical protein
MAGHSNSMLFPVEPRAVFSDRFKVLNEAGNDFDERSCM